MTGHLLHGMHTGVAGAALMGLLTSVLAPLLVLAGRRRAARSAASARSRPWLAAGILVAFTVVHAATVLLIGPDTATSVTLAVHVVLLLGAVAFWLPVLGHGTTRLPDAGRAIYLFLACPLLDTAALALVVRGDEPAGVAMIVAMLPIGAAAIVLTLRWIAVEEREAHAVDEALEEVR
ncbi:hypothetical protein [Actinomycetospora lemnae]|uniref:Uncharacterized protein n=1 Tax=Actinomycetospora lemnae TaxID=3019891 RepID=A0ABT5SYU3_9PSEU|nr:hypothetical protein [Actinomycetospora sp. DW7H6]MDD7968038.1 hypothetical protein [Actinomycetospora sp. DW7H6]